MVGETLPAFPGHAQPAILRIWHQAYAYLKINKAFLLQTEDIFKCILSSEEFSILIQMSVKFLPEGPIDD